MKITVSLTEEKYRKKCCTDFALGLNEAPKCTVCEAQLRGEIGLDKPKKPKKHPLLEVLICKKCLEFYHVGEFSLDEDGNEDFCRWCGQGGTLICCSNCRCAFCKKCIKRNLSRPEVKQINEGEDWHCFVCDITPLWKARALCWSVLNPRQYQEIKEQRSDKNLKLNGSTHKKGEETTDNSSDINLHYESDSEVDVKQEKNKFKSQKDLAKPPEPYTIINDSKSEEESNNFKINLKNKKFVKSVKPELSFELKQVKAEKKTGTVEYSNKTTAKQVWMIPKREVLSDDEMMQVDGQPSHEGTRSGPNDLASTSGHMNGNAEPNDKDLRSGSHDLASTSGRMNVVSEPNDAEMKSGDGGKGDASNLDKLKSEMCDSDEEDDNPLIQRRNIARVMGERELVAPTQLAAKEEKRRKQRVAKRLKLHKELCSQRQQESEGDEVRELVLEFDPTTKQPILEVDKKLLPLIKPHQIDGIKFMWDTVFETVKLAKSSPGSGCILAHCMGLGKTMQVVLLVHTLLTHPELGVRTVLVVAPISTASNWCSEFQQWLRDVAEIKCLNFSLISPEDRAKEISDWHETGGVAVIGYQMYRQLTRPKRNQHNRATFHQCLVDPGPDLVVCDEGHLLKNINSIVSKQMNKIATKRRIVLTGTPMQNNLVEYYCMMQFVKPNLLGSSEEFANRFINPISNGQCSDSTPLDVQVMKMRAHVLHTLVKGFVQRVDFSVLAPVLSKKQEYVIKVRLSELQVKLYRLYLATMIELQGEMKVHMSSFVADYHNLQGVWTHPLSMQLRAEREHGNMMEEEEEDIEWWEEPSDEESLAESNKRKKQIAEKYGNGRKLRKRCGLPEDKKKLNKEQSSRNLWWSEHVQFDDLENMSHSGKLVLLFSIINECQGIGEKVLVFSQSLLSLDLIEAFLRKVDDATQEDSSTEHLGGLKGCWIKNQDYFRIDGSTTAFERTMYCKFFNNPANLRGRLFLISTRAGGLGINMVGANRVVLFDASWNPCDDLQAIFRVYRYGQTKPCFIYRLLAAGSMEEKIYDRQVTKLALSGRVVDKQQIDRHFKAIDLKEIYNFNPEKSRAGKITSMMVPPKDALLACLLVRHAGLVDSYFEHDSLLESKPEENLSKDERRLAWQDFETDKDDKQERREKLEACLKTRARHEKKSKQESDHQKQQEQLQQQQEEIQEAPMDLSIHPPDVAMGDGSDMDCLNQAGGMHCRAGR